MAAIGTRVDYSRSRTSKRLPVFPEDGKPQARWTDRARAKPVELSILPTEHHGLLEGMSRVNYQRRHDRATRVANRRQAEWNAGELKTTLKKSGKICARTSSARTSCRRARHTAAGAEGLYPEVRVRPRPRSSPAPQSIGRASRAAAEDAGAWGCRSPPGLARSYHGRTKSSGSLLTWPSKRTSNARWRLS